MNDLLEANKVLLDNMKRLTAKVKQLKEENKQLKENSSAILLTEEQKREIDNLLLETKKVLEEA